MSKAPMIGQRRLRMVLEQPVETADAIGGVSRSFAARTTLWVRMEPVSALEPAEAQRAEAMVTHRLTLRWRGDITAAMRFVADGRIYAIHGQHDPDGRRRNLVVTVEEVQT